MECRLCCKTFLTVKEVVIHERVSHARVRKLSSYECEYCGDCFATKHVRDNHLLRHFEESIGDIWDRVEQMQCELTGVVVINQCPICSSVLATRRSFRVHVVQKHLLKDPEVFLGQFFFIVKSTFSLDS
ncbi:zinc finger, C2H2 type [Cooperia oncophora]